jgi:TRAP-type transport system periplasmic protein
MKKTILGILVLAVVASMLFAGCTTPATTITSTTASTITTASTVTTTATTTKITSTTKPTTVTLNAFTFWGALSPFSLMINDWLRNIELRSQGQVKISWFPGDSLISGMDYRDALTKNIADLGTIYRTSDKAYPATAYFVYPQGMSNAWTLSMVANDYFNKFQPAELSDLHIFWQVAVGPSHLLGGKKPITNTNDLKGLVIRSGAAVSVYNDIWKAAGAQIINTPVVEVHDVLGKGTADAANMPIEAIISFSLADVVNSIVRIAPLLNSDVIFMAMTKAKWDALPAEVKTIFDDTAKEWQDKMGMTSQYLNVQGTDAVVAKGGKVVTFSAEETAKMVALATPLFAANSASIGISPDQQAIYKKYIDEQAAKWVKSEPSDAQIRTWFEANLKPLIPKK